GYLMIGHSESLNGIDHPLWQKIGFIALGPGWLAMVVYLHLVHGTPLSKLVTKIDFWFRWALIAYLIVAVSVSFYIGRLDPAPWVGLKLLVFGALVFCGLMIRIYIPDYIAGIIKLRRDEIDDDANESMARSLARCRPFVLAIWVGLVIECYLGVAKPGHQVPVAEVLGAAGSLAGY
ncbi:MAG: hypothetical protein ACE5G3_11950, partial [Gammaproteobacteria bacterium]